MVIKDDPTLLFVNAGMNQFKDIFLGNISPFVPSAVNSQKCLRVSGKHNDLEEVGHDTYHHTMFEMLGNWSFGDYFKQEAIVLAWDFLTKELKISEERLYVTFFNGDKKDRLQKDDDTKNIWNQIVSQDQIVAGSKKDNFWEMGKNGPCGPCTEIHIDLRSDIERAKISTQSLINQGHSKVIEIWNLVFIEFNRKENGVLELLPKKHVDTGMGFERLCMVLQNKTSTYDTDIFGDLIQDISKISKINYGDSEKTDIAIRVIVDHIRAIGFSIADGQLPNNTGAGYVIRRILRRAIRYGYTYLNLKEPFLYKLIDSLSRQFRSFFPEIEAQRSMIENVIKEEENTFLNTLGKGLELISKSIELLASDTNQMDGSDVFELYDTYGFPPDLTALILKEKGLGYDQIQFDKEMKKQKIRSRSASKVTLGDWIMVNDIPIEGFVGYDYTYIDDAQLVKYRKVTQKDKNHYHLVFNKTPFYPEGGGQVGDIGVVQKNSIKNNSDKVSILDTKKENNTIIHIANSIPFGNNSIQHKHIFLSVNDTRRLLIQRNHSATHLLHSFLRKILGTHVEQKGSFVGPNYLRFDFSHFKKIEDKYLTQIEDEINHIISTGLKLEEFKNIPIDKAQEMGAMSLFGEKYGDTVRVIQFGDSIEFCGGTHVSESTEIGVFKIISESSIASGIRRIEAVTSQGAVTFFNKKLTTLNKLQHILKNTDNVVGAVQKLISENKRLHDMAAVSKKYKGDMLMQELSNKILKINGVQCLLHKLDVDVATLKNICFSFIQKHDDLVLALVTTSDSKVILNIALSKNLVQARKLNASQIINQVGKHIEAKGGGQPFFAIASGHNLNGVEYMFDEVKEIIKAS